MEIRYVAEVGGYDSKKWGKPWVAVADPKGGMYFSELIGGCEDGKIYFTDDFLHDGCIFAWGQKDYKGSGSYIHYLQVWYGIFFEISKDEAKSLAKTVEQKRLLRRIKKIEDAEYQKRILAETYALPAAVVLENEYPHIVRRLYPDWGKKPYNDVELASMVGACKWEKEKTEGK